MIVLELGSQTRVAWIGVRLYCCQASYDGDMGSRSDFGGSSNSWFESSQPESSDNVSSVNENWRIN